MLATDDVTFSVPQGQFLAVIGPSGCGKTTILNMLAGLLPTSSGVVAVRGERVTAPNREIGYMSARDGLLPWRTARENVELGLEIRGMAKSQRRRKADELLALVGLEGFEDSHRAQLSQGMRQRVAIARTLAIEPSILLMDEPFAALDAQTKTTLQQHFAQLWEQDRKTVMLVTHDIEEAVALADRVLVFSPRPGRIVADIEIDIPRPRAINEVRFTERFRGLTHELWKSLHGSTEGAA
ncbi:MAG TPA: ABC transporter ATP-binding protein [Actinomycetales bacterium]|nr:ABC transporter ATP-binding protein [Actinomycetales bacterium]